MASRAKQQVGFGETIGAAYATESAAIELDTGVHEGALLPEAAVRIPFKMMNRHGLVAGATGTGKTRTLQVIAEQLSAAGVAVSPPTWRATSPASRCPARTTARRRSARESSASSGLQRASPSSTSHSAASARAFPCERPCPTSGRSCSRRCSARTRPRSTA